MLNKFFTYKDEMLDKIIFPLDHQFFWSRIYEYIFCLKFAKYGDIVCDIATGTYHPFKFALCDIVGDNNVYVCDIDNLSQENILNEIESKFGKEELEKFDKSYFNRINFDVCNIVDMYYEDNKFDLIFIISSIEHMDKDTIKKGLKECCRILKNGGKLIITADFPSTSPEEIIGIAKESGFIVDGDYNYDLPLSDAITSTYFGSRLFCYSIVLKKF
jgi:ubiquinone/menaquinone biosynthesis C-methylase UbiE